MCYSCVKLKVLFLENKAKHYHLGCNVGQEHCQDFVIEVSAMRRQKYANDKESNKEHR